jgi:hypothetical protein
MYNIPWRDADRSWLQRTTVFKAIRPSNPYFIFFLVVYYSTPLRIMFMISSFIPLFLCHCTRFLKYICFHINNLFFLKFVHRFRNHLKDYKCCSYLQINTNSVTLLVEETAMPRENHRQTFYIQHEHIY